ncbi:MAG: GNAT family N-acetyltransferase [Clostridiales bacterium]|nr:MAG: GNAT family N-acetyltransferase [Clostridiales bacterium]RGB63968.1 GNAT family N-acetyltransferase [Harryflintia acetispora]
MLIQGLVRLERKDIGRLVELMSDSFMQDPLYQKLIPDETVREKLLPRYFRCYLGRYFDYCHAFADSEEMNGAIVVFDDSDEHNALRYRFDGLRYELLEYFEVLRSDPSLRTFRKFRKNKQFLTSDWVRGAIDAPDVHLDLLAVRQSARGKGVARKLMEPFLQYAEQRRYSATLETHNPRNVAIYQRFGFQTVLELGSGALHQYCMVR